LQYGVAKEASIVSVKVLSADGTGSLSGVVKGIDFVANRKISNVNQPMVASK